MLAIALQRIWFTFLGMRALTLWFRVPTTTDGYGLYLKPEIDANPQISKQQNPGY
jgi:hypothetical protein